MKYMKFFWWALLWSMPLFAQENIDVSYLVRYNDDLFGGRSDRMHTGYLKIRGDRSVSYFVAKEEYKSRGQFDGTMRVDTMFYVYNDLKQNSNVFQDYDLSGKIIWVSDSLHPMNWIIDTAQKKVGDWLCTKARTTFRGRNYIAWFTPSVPIPFGPWKMGGLPGLIVELEDDEQNLVVRIMNFKVVKGNELIMPIPKMDWNTSVNKKRKLLEKIRGGSNATGSTDCIGCQNKSVITAASWERF